MDGFLEPLKEKRDRNEKIQKFLCLGAGGAARAIIAGFHKENAKKITIVK